MGVQSIKSALAMVGIAAMVAIRAAGCGGGNGNGDTDTSTDTTTDTSTDTTTDTSTDVLPDTADDTADDTTSDTAADTAGDTTGDTSADTVADTVADTPEDTVADTATDTAEETPTCLPPATSTGDQGHRPGQDCLGCHDSMGAFTWTVAGTLYDAATGGAAVSGATIIITDATGAELQLVTHPNGNFYTSQALTFPLSVAASKCPDHQEMGSDVSDGSCNSCHDTTFRIHLP